MRFNDLLQTVLANLGDGTVATVTRWRQCIDLLAQYDISGARAANALGAGERESVLALVEQMRPHLSVDQRVASIIELGGRLRSPGLVRLLSQDHPSLVSAMMASARLTDEDWAAIIPALGPLARSVLRRRTDLGSAATAALHRFGSVDLTLTSLVSAEESVLSAASEIAMALAANDTDAGDEPSQIGRIVAQIERFKDERLRHHEDNMSARDEPEALDLTHEFFADVAADSPVAVDPPNYQINEFTFETDGAGLIRSITGAPRTAGAGLSIGVPSIDSRHGADGTALGAFRRRAGFEDARFTIGEGLLEGDWRISAEPRFDRSTGRFLSYTGLARRELPHEALVKATTDARGWAGLSASSTRQLIHELRTPLNAIHGYAEMIEAQLMGPVASDYRDMARQILTDARSLIGTFEDLDLASRIERGDGHAISERIDPEQIVRAIVASLDPTGSCRINLVVDKMLPEIGGDRAQVERMLSHLFRAGCTALGEDEWLMIALSSEASGRWVQISMQRPVALRHITEDALLDHGYLVDQKLLDAPPLGLAFTLKLVRGIAIHLGGRFDIAPDSFGLTLPVAVPAEGERENLR
jgi:signal transduction histidine kinase